MGKKNSTSKLPHSKTNKINKRYFYPSILNLWCNMLVKTRQQRHVRRSFVIALPNNSYERRLWKPDDDCDDDISILTWDCELEPFGPSLQPRPHVLHLVFVIRFMWIEVCNDSLLCCVLPTSSLSIYTTKKNRIAFIIHIIHTFCRTVGAHSDKQNFTNLITSINFVHIVHAIYKLWYSLSIDKKIYNYDYRINKHNVFTFHKKQQ